MKTLEEKVRDTVWAHHTGPYPVVVVYKMLCMITFLPSDPTTNNVDLKWDKITLENAEYFEPELRLHLNALAETIADIRPKRFAIEQPTAHERIESINSLSTNVD